MPAGRSVVIVGASMAGTHTAQQLRDRGFDGPIALIGAESHPPYDRPPLSKQLLLGTAGADDARLLDDGQLAALDVDLRLGVRAVAVEGDGVHLADGRVVPGDVVVLATGVTPRRLPDQPEIDAVLTLRTVDDAVQLRRRLLQSPTVAIIGAGLIGGEVASAARELGCAVTMIEALPLPMERSLGPTVGELLAQLYRANGVDLHASSLATLVPHRERVRVAASDGCVTEVDTVIVAIGARPNSTWLTGFPLDEDGGIRCDGAGRVVGRPGCFAVGDVASWFDSRHGDTYRTEHWTSARTQAAVVAATICDVAPPSGLPDYAWTDQFGLKIQVVGRPDRADDAQLLEPGTPAGSVIGYFEGDALVGATIFGAPRRLRHYCQHVLVGARRGEVTVAASTSERPAQAARS